MRVDILTSPEQLAALRPAWTELAQSATVASVFTTWEWQVLWWRHYGARRRLCVLVARDEEQVCGILPLYIQTIRLFRVIPVRVLRPVGTGGDTAPDYLDPLLAPGREEATARTFADYIANELPGWNVACLTDLDERSAFLEALTRACAAPGWAVQTGVSARISYIHLPRSWDAYLEGLSPNRRYTIRRTRRKFEELPGARFRVWDDGATLDDAVSRLIELHHGRWRKKNQAHSFSSPEYIAFHRDVIRACFEKDRLRLFALLLGDEAIAMYYCYRFRDQVFYFQGGFDPEHEQLRPGLVLMGYAIEHALREGNRVFDMLRGEYEYKTQWAKDRRETRFVDVFRPSWATWVYRVRRNWLPRIRRQIAWVRPALADRRRRVQAC